MRRPEVEKGFYYSEDCVIVSYSVSFVCLSSSLIREMGMEMWSSRKDFYFLLLGVWDRWWSLCLLSELSAH